MCSFLTPQDLSNQAMEYATSQQEERDNSGNNPTIDILLATYQGERFVSTQIESIQNQTYRNWRLIISDDMSTDSTVDILRGFAKADDRINILRNSHRYGSAKLNFFNLVDQSTSEYTCFCDQDDIWNPDKLQLSLDEMRSLERQHGMTIPLLIFGDMEVVDDELKCIAPSFERFSRTDPGRVSFEQLLSQSVGAGCTMTINSALVRMIKGSSEFRDKAVMHDWWAFLIAASFGSIGHIDRPLSKYRQHATNVDGAIRYSPLKRIQELNKVTQRTSETFQQAMAFWRCYGDRLQARHQKHLWAYASLPLARKLVRPLLLTKSRAFRNTPLRRVGQFVTIFLLPVATLRERNCDSA